MEKKREKQSILNNYKDTSKSFYSKLSQNDLIKIEKVKEIILPIKEKYDLTFNDLKRLLEELSFPDIILNKKLTVLESVVKYLKEEKNLSLREISNIIKRDERNIWHIYDNTKKKYSERFFIKQVNVWIPISIFSDTRLSALESIVKYLREELSLNYHEIAILLRRDDRTIWTVYQRARRKNEKSK